MRHPWSDAGSRKLTALRALFTLTLFLSSGLLFLVQPMVAKMILPRFGGSSAVWTTSMLFFQVLLLLGYAYAHVGIKWLGVRRQALLHVIFLSAAVWLTTLHLPSDSATEINPWIVLAILTTMVGAPFFILSAGAPLIQKWFANTTDPQAKSPYFLYSASNLGSMIALLAYPTLIEPRLTLGRQSDYWKCGLLALIVAMAACVVSLFRHHAPMQQEETEVAEPIPWALKLQWVALAAVPSSLLLGVTQFITTNIAPMPLLWVIPLALYLMTFIVAFANRRPTTSGLWARILPLVATPLVLVMILESSEPMGLLIAMHLVAFTVAALMCHFRLVETEPGAGRLTEFYLWLSVGGAVGGLFNALIAPQIFSTLAEYPVAIVAACLLRPGKVRNLRLDIAFAVGMLLLTIGLAFAVRAFDLPPSQARTGLVIGLPAILCFLMVDHPVRYALMIGSLLLGSNLMQTNSAGRVVYTGRSMFGVHRVVALENGRYQELVHGNTTHGIQDTLNPREPKTYYTRSGPIGQVFEAFPNVQDIGMVGMGVGSCAAYGRSGQSMIYFEIDPIVEKIARNPAYFTFLKDARSELEIILGDARLTLGAHPGKFDILVLDAFSSDSIPAHLLTKEAVAMYKSKLKPGGIMAFHISNRFLDLEPILSKVAQSLDMTALIQRDETTEEDDRAKKFPSNWMVMAPESSSLEPLRKTYFWSDATHQVGTPLWTDDYSNILSAYK